jgi:hypothetical protein
MKNAPHVAIARRALLALILASRSAAAQAPANGSGFSFAVTRDR